MMLRTPHPQPPAEFSNVKNMDEIPGQKRVRTGQINLVYRMLYISQMPMDKNCNLFLNFNGHSSLANLR